MPAPVPVAVPAPPPAGGGAHDWLAYVLPGCCGPVGADGPIRGEAYVRGGPSFPFGEHVFAHTLAVGWTVEGGARSLFFNPAQDAAWTADLSVSNTYNHSTSGLIRIPFLSTKSGEPRVFFGREAGFPGVTVAELNRTFVNLSLGREWYLDPANGGGPAVRFGADAGGRLGTGNVEFHETQHHSDTIYGVFVAVHADVEYPFHCGCGGGCCCTFVAGLRAEWSYTWSDLLQSQNNGDLMDADVLLTAGVRF
jgi:hypothetical protein